MSASKGPTPVLEHESALENELPRMAGPRESKEEAFHGVVLEQFVEGPPLFASSIQEPGVNRSCKIPILAHWSASR